MIEIEEDCYGPYDNVEFPIRQQPAAAGTWPRANANANGLAASSSSSSSSSTSASSSASSSGGAKIFGQHSLRNTGPRLAPLIEVEMTSDSNENNRVGPGTPFPTTSSSATLPPSYRQTTSSMSSNNKTVQSNQTSGTRAASDKSSTSNATPAITTDTTTFATSTKSPITTSSTAVASSSTPTTSTTSNQSSKPAVMPIPNDLSTYVHTSVTSTSDTLKKKNSTLKQVSVEDEDFKRHDLNPSSRQALERVYICHPDFYQLNSKILDEGSLLKQDVNEIYMKSGETLTYEQLLQGMMVDGERFLLGGCWLYFSYVQFLDVEGTKILREPYRRGRVGLTSKRALFLSTETFTDAALEPYGDPTKPKAGGFKLEVSKQSNVVFKNIPLTNFHSAEMEVITGTSAQTKITKDSVFCGCFGRPGKWESTTPMTRSINSRVLRVGVSMPPWQTRMFMDIHLDPAMSLTTARDFISQLHQFAPHMN